MQYSITYRRTDVLLLKEGSIVAYYELKGLYDKLDHLMLTLKAYEIWYEYCLYYSKHT